jgi:hypothetical protein
MLIQVLLLLDDASLFTPLTSASLSVSLPAGDCTLLGEIDIKNFIAGEPLSQAPTTSSNFTETGMGLMRAMFRTSGISLDTAPALAGAATPQANQSSGSGSNPNGPSENVVQILLNDIRVMIAKDPSKSYSARLGRSAADNSRDKSVTFPSFPSLSSLL